MTTLPRIIIGVDPGKITGLAALTADGSDLGVFYSDELDFLATGRTLRTLLDAYGGEPTLQVAVERFVITPQTAKKSQAPWSLEVIGMCKWLIADITGRDPDSTVSLQAPGDAKGLIVNDILKRYGLWHRGGAGHANDAIRHAVYRYARLGWKTPWET